MLCACACTCRLFPDIRLLYGVQKAMDTVLSHRIYCQVGDIDQGL